MSFEFQIDFIFWVSVLLVIAFINKVLNRKKKKIVSKAQCENCPYRKNPEPVMQKTCPVKELLEEFTRICGIGISYLDKEWMLRFKSIAQSILEKRIPQCEGVVILKKAIGTHGLLHLNKDVVYELLLQSEIILKTNCTECLYFSQSSKGD